jgi:methylthioribulose-1-phosphate dehydratase
MEMESMNAQLFVELMCQFYDQGWMLGSSGGMAACLPEGHLLVTPSSVPKERLNKSDLFLFDQSTFQSGQEISAIRPIQGPVHLHPSACTPVFLLLLQSSPGAQCVIHTHSKCANLITAKLAEKNRFEIRDQEMLKGVLNRAEWKPIQNTDLLSLPIVENAPKEEDLLASFISEIFSFLSKFLKPAMEKALTEFPCSSAILVRRHGLFVWGPSWQKTKVMLECLEYLLELAWEMSKADPAMS